VAGPRRGSAGEGLVRPQRVLLRRVDQPRFVDFDLFHQSPEAENCYGPFHKADLSEGPPDLAEELRKPLAAPGDKTTGWAGADRLIWEGWIDAGAKPDPDAPGLVFRLDLYVGERDTRGIGFSDNVIFRKQYYVQAFPGDPLALFVHTGEEHLSAKDPATREQLEALAQQGAGAAVQAPTPTRDAGPGGSGEWSFQASGTGFAATLRLAVDPVHD
jgi:hypothetical protein